MASKISCNGDRSFACYPAS